MRHNILHSVDLQMHAAWTRLHASELKYENRWRSQMLRTLPERHEFVETQDRRPRTASTVSAVKTFSIQRSSWDGVALASR